MGPGQASARLARLNERVGNHFDSVAVKLGELGDEQSLARWAGICVRVADAGWHSYEAANAYIGLSIPLAQAAGVERLLAAGEFGHSLCDYSYEPGKVYFEVYLSLLESGQGEIGIEVQRIGEKIHRRYSQASTLLGDYFRGAAHIARTRGAHQMSAWLSCVEALTPGERGALLQLIGASRTVDSVSWEFVARLKQLSSADCLTYLEYYRNLQQHYSRDVLQDLEPSIIAFASGPHGATELYDALLSHPLTDQDARALVRFLPRFDDDVRLAARVVVSAPSLPLDQPAVMVDWIDHGQIMATMRFEAASAWFSLESSQSRETLDGLAGRVHLDDCKRILQLLAEAICNRPLAIEAVDPESADFRDLPGTDGRTVFMPGSVAIYPDRHENFSYFKVALVHQLGFFEFGTFRRLGSLHRFLRSSSSPNLARQVFQILEDARVDWRLSHKFRGIAVAIRRQQSEALSRRSLPKGRIGSLLEAMIRFSLGESEPLWIADEYKSVAAALIGHMRPLASPDSVVDDSLALIDTCVELIGGELDEAFFEMADEVLPETVPYRGESDTDQVMINLAIDLDGMPEPEAEESLSIATLVDPDNAKIVEIRRGDIGDAEGMSIDDLDIDLKELLGGDGDDEPSEEIKRKFDKGRSGIAGHGRQEFQFRYDEWDYVINDYRRRWCTLNEIRVFDEDPQFFESTLREQRHLVRGVRRQLHMLKPEMLRKVKGMADGDELDIERAVEAVVDRRSGFTPGERIYVQRQRKDRDVAALFLLDMSASTDDIIALGGEQAQAAEGAPDEKRIIDLEKESVVVMCEALEELGDNYSVCGFSGYGREQVDYYLCKDFDEPLNYATKGRIGGIKPCRSTRMGPAIRHGIASLNRTECRIQALIIISDGYPQDFDYGKDRNSKEYGIMDTMKALTEARGQGVQSFCLTVDPSGHDYLRAMCPDSQYMVMQDLRQLPNELSKVYRSLTG
ncbi:MAG: hypothetical protein O2780_04735 [Proteobacteria bacterium]|nr:hypothetical protein [Pseudomonadota bacterium]